jgi:hypothetical protein
MCPARFFKLTAMSGFIKQYADAEFDPTTISILEGAWSRMDSCAGQQSTLQQQQICTRRSRDHCHLHHQRSKSGRT